MKKTTTKAFILMVLLGILAFPMLVFAAEYNGITIDGQISDWDAIQKNQLAHEDWRYMALDQTAMVWDGDYVYIYMHEDGQEQSVTWSGANSNGMFVISTDLGANTNFQLVQRNNRVEITGVNGATIMYSKSDKAYEIAIPSSELGKCNQTISLSYFLGKELAGNVANLQGSGGGTFDGIVYDGLYGDWDYYPHELIQYSTDFSDNRGALYADGNTLYGHVFVASSQMHNLCTRLFKDIDIRVNGFDGTNKVLYLKLAQADAWGNLEVHDDRIQPAITNHVPGNYEYYLIREGSSEDHTNINDPQCEIFGKIKISVTDTNAQMEFAIDMTKLASHFNLPVNDLQLIEAHYENLGNEWISYGGTSTGPIAGIIACAVCALVGAFIFDKSVKKKQKEKVV